MQTMKALTAAAALMCVAGPALLTSSSAQANVVVEQGGAPIDLRTNVLFDQGPPCNPCFGDLAGGAQNVILFSSATDTLVTEASGQSRITSTDFVAGPGPGGDTGGINQLSITAAPQFQGFEAIQLNLNAELGSVVSFSAADQFNNTIPLGSFNLGVGANRFTFLSDATQFITSLNFTSNAGEFALQDVRQVRIGDLIPVPGPIAGAGLPGLLLICGAGLLGLLKRLRNRALAV